MNGVGHQPSLRGARRVPARSPLSTPCSMFARIQVLRMPLDSASVMPNAPQTDATASSIGSAGCRHNGEPDAGKGCA